MQHAKHDHYVYSIRGRGGRSNAGCLWSAISHFVIGQGLQRLRGVQDRQICQPYSSSFPLPTLVAHLGDFRSRIDFLTCDSDMCCHGAKDYSFTRVKDALPPKTLV
jgi:hypothetical protein